MPVPMPMTLPTLLLTGFEPFGDEPVNPSELVAAALHGVVLEGGGRQARVVAQRLPCAFGAAQAMLNDAIRSHPPLAVLALGLAAGRAALTPERVAINLADARIADNDGAQPCDEPLALAGPAAFFSTLPVKAMVAAMQGVGAPAALSLSAGSFVCNAVFYGLMQSLAAMPVATRPRGGFMHLPLLPAQAAAPHGGGGFRPSVSLALQVQAVAAALGAVLAHEHDLRALGGSES
jgi:pyroglutamyl-peptidase